MGTTENLQAAFAGESQANRKYLAFGEKAKTQGFPQIAKLFRAAAAAETVHAHAHLRVLGGIKDTADNLQEAINGEGHEFKEMYPAFLKDAEAEGNRAAVVTIKNAMAVEEVHYAMYSEALAKLKAGQDLSEMKVWVCAVCGNTVIGEAPDKCSICNVGKDKFVEVE